MDCRDCARYDEANDVCLDRKLNPKRWEDAVTVSQLMGIRSICVFSDFRERLVASRRPLDAARTDRIFGPRSLR